MTPAGVSKGALTTDMLLVVDSQGRMTEPSSYRPSSDDPPAPWPATGSAPMWAGRIVMAHPPAATALRLHQYGQKKFIMQQGATVEEFRALFGKNYL